MASDKDVTVYNIGNTLNEEINVWYDKKTIIRFSEFSHLPCKKFVKIVKRNNEKVLKIQKQQSVEEIQLPDYDRFLVTISFDVNGIYSVLFKELPKLSKIDAEIEMLYSKLENKAFAELHPLNFNKKYSIPTNIDLSDDKINAIGIDLGGMQCCAAVGRRNGMETVVLENMGERLLPAFVGFDEKYEKCGGIVIKRLRNHAKTSVFGLKKIIGRKHNEVVIDKTWPFKIINVENNEIRIQIKTKDNESISKYPEEVLAVILKHIKNKVQEFQGKELGRVVLAIPQNFNEKQRNATFISAVLAGWKSIHFLPEPIAVAFAYFADKTFSTNCSVLVVDLGAQALDVSVLNVDNGQIYVHTNYTEYFGVKLKTDFGIKLDETKMQKLMIKCSEIIKDVSHTSDTWLDVDEFDLSSDEKISITRKKFEELSSLLLFKIKETIKFTLQKGHIIEFDKIFYVGGGCRMPMIKELLQNMFPNVEHCFQINPEEVIAIGAAYYSYYLNSSTRNLISATVNNSFVFDILQMFIRQKTEITKIFEPK
uniref:Heat shock protein 70 n=1 Tax=Panagrolaimus davidi TaxID=227884 RepID=A0A914P9R9_9BILA